MSSEDVIELGSSDEEPAPKRSKLPSNQMVCIPNKLGEVTIKPAAKSPKPAGKSIKSAANSIVSASIATGLARKGITVKKVTNPKSQQSKQNGKLSTQLSKPIIGVNPFSGLQKGATIPVKPLSTAERLIKSGLIKVLPKQSVPIAPVSKSPLSRSPVTQLKNPIKINKNTGGLNLLPNISVKKTSSIPVLRLKKGGKLQIKKQRKNIDEVLTVELDDEVDDKPSSRNASPQWYIKPEDHSPAGSTPTPEEENNKEPEAPNLIEITIEDSPVKPIPNKKTHVVGAELAITIDDSPVKAAAGKRPHKSGSESEGNSSGSGKQPPSKKKLNYPKEADSRKTIEIEINPIETIAKDDSTVKDNNDDAEKLDDNKSKTVDKEKGENSEKNSNVQTLSEKKKTNEQENKMVVDITNITTQPSEFNPVYQSFIDLCFKLENSDDMFKIVEKKIKGYYRQVPKEYTDSEEFTDMVSSKILAMTAGPEKMYLYIKDIVDELNLQRKLAKSQPVVQETKSEEHIQLYEEEERVYGNSKRQRQIRKLEKTIKKLHRAIQKLEEQEVDFEDEDDSVYLLTERYKERMVRVYAKFCQLSNTKMPSEPRIQIDARPGQPTGPAKRLEKWINKKVPIGTPLPFPDFHDVLRCVREANDEDRLGWNEVDVMEEARDLFTRCGRKLQRRRQENEWRLAASRIPQEADPAEKNPDLKRKLSENKKIASHKETEIFNKYADRQKQLKLEGEEIGDKEAEESPVESEEEEATEESASKESKEQRKERLKRLLHKKPRKSTDEKENKVLNENPTNENIEMSEPAVETETIVKETKIIEVENKEQNNMDESKDEEKKMDDSKIDDAISDETKLDINKEDQHKLNDSKEMETKLNKKKEVEIKKERDGEQSKNNEKNSQNATETLTLSDDSSALESDVDELHLLQKLHSANEAQSSSIDSDDSDSPIAISDSLDSDDDNKKETNDNDDVISIENSSYSEDDGDTIHFINDDSSQDGVVNLITPKKKEGATSRSADQITDDESKDDTLHNMKVSNMDSVQLIRDDSSPGENTEQANDKENEDSTGRLVIEQIVSDHSNTASQDSDAPVVTGVIEVEFTSIGNLKLPLDENVEPVEDITLASSDEEVNAADQKDNAVCLEGSANIQQDITVDRTIADCQKIDAVSIKDDINCPEINADCQKVSDCQEYNVDYQEENANHQDNNAVGQEDIADGREEEGIVDCKENNADCQENNAIGQEDNIVDQEGNAVCKEDNAFGHEHDTVVREDNALGKEKNTHAESDNAVGQVNCQELNADCQEDLAVAQEDNADCQEINTDCQELNADYQEDSVDAKGGKQVCEQDNVDCQEINSDSQEVIADCQEVNSDCQEVNAECQEVNTVCQELNEDCQEVNSDCQEVNADCQEVNSDCQELNTDCQEVEPDIIEEITDSQEENVDSQEENGDSQEENGDSQEENGDSQEEECVNLRDDLISIDETIVGNINVDNKPVDIEPYTIAVEEVDDSSGEVVIAESNESEVEMKSQSGDDDVQFNEESTKEETKSDQSSQPIETMEIDDDDDNTINESVNSREENGTSIISLES